MGALRAGDENLRRLSALIPFCPTCQFTMTIPADPAAIPIVTDGVGELIRVPWLVFRSGRLTFSNESMDA